MSFDFHFDPLSAMIDSRNNSKSCCDLLALCIIVRRIPLRFLFCRLAGLLLSLPCPFLIGSNVRVPLIRACRWRNVLQSSKLLRANTFQVIQHSGRPPVLGCLPFLPFLCFVSQGRQQRRKKCYSFHVFNLFVTFVTLLAYV